MQKVLNAIKAPVSVAASFFGTVRKYFKQADNVGNLITEKFKRLNLRKYAFVSAVGILVIALAFAFILHQRKTVSIIIDGNTKNVVTYLKTFNELLNDEKISLDPKDKIDRDLNEKMSRRDTLKINKAVNVTINVDGKELKLKSAEKDVSTMLNAEGITIANEDKISPSLSDNVVDGISVNIVRVETKTITENQPVDFKTAISYDSNLLETQTKVHQKGTNGEKQITYKVTYENGIEVSKLVTNEVVLKQPVNEIQTKGSLPVFNVSRGESGLSYSKEFVVKATAYYAINGIGKTYTATGRKAVRDPYGYSTIAVDPSVIPYGTKLYVEGYGYALAADTGEAIRGNFIDVYFDTYNEMCNWAVKYVKVYILK